MRWLRLSRSESQAQRAVTSNLAQGGQNSNQMTAFKRMEVQQAPNAE